MDYLKKIFRSLIYLFVFLMPWQAVFIIQEKFINGYKWQGGTLMVFATEIILWLIIILGFFILLKEKAVFRLKLSILTADKGKLFLILSIWLFVLWSLTSIIWSFDRQVAFLSWFHVVEAVALFFVLIRNEINLKCLCWSLAFSSVIQSILTIWQFFSQAIYANKWLGLAEHLSYKVGTYVVENADGRWLRAYGSFAHPNILAGFLVLGFFCALFLYLQSRGKIRIALVFVILFISLGIFLSFSRGAWLAMVVSYVIWLFLEVKLRIREKREIKYLSAITLSLALMIISLSFIYWPLLSSRFSGTDRLEVKSNTQRINSLSQSWQIITNHGSMGVGMGNYIPAIHKLSPDSPGWSYEPAHNIYLLLWSELGSFGLIIFLIIYVLILLRSLVERKYLFLSLALSLGIIGLFDHYFWTQYVGIIIWWLAWFLCINLFNFREKNYENQKEIDS